MRMVPYHQDQEEYVEMSSVPQHYIHCQYRCDVEKLGCTSLRIHKMRCPCTRENRGPPLPHELEIGAIFFYMKFEGGLFLEINGTSSTNKFSDLTSQQPCCCSASLFQNTLFVRVP